MVANASCRYVPPLKDSTTSRSPVCVCVNFSSRARTDRPNAWRCAQEWDGRRQSGHERATGAITHGWKVRLIIPSPAEGWQRANPCQEASPAYLLRTVTTGQGAVLTTRSATLPRKSFEKPLRP
jgi:hypothetical protein